MRRRRRLIAGLVVATAVLIGVLALALKDFVREAIVLPLSYTFAGVRDVIERLPQTMLWIVFIVVLTGLAIAILLVTTQVTRRFRSPERQHRGRVEKWMRWIEMATHPSAQYSWQYTALRLRDLALDVLADRELLARDEIAQQLQSKQVEMPPEIRTQVEGLLAIDSTQRLLENGNGSESRGDAGGIDIEQIVRYLEDQLEVRRDG